MEGGGPGGGGAPGDGELTSRKRGSPNRGWHWECFYCWVGGQRNTETLRSLL